jgi:peptidoglycan/xylan/chitin deacetylase (PgdA/CDA1 family)
MSSLATITESAPRRSRWPRPLAVDVSVGVHLSAGAAAWAVPGAEAWAAGAVAMNHVVLTGAGLLPRAALLGPNLRRLPEVREPHHGAAAHEHRASARRVTLTFDDGPDPEVTPQVLDQLGAAGARASFFCIAERARRHPALVREIVARGHCVQNHSASHRHHFSLLGPRGFEREIGAAQALLSDLTGHPPHCFRAPAGVRNPLLDPVLHRLDLHLVSWTRRGFDTVDANPERVLARLLRGLAARDILLLHDGHAKRMPGGRPVVLEVLPALLARLRDAGLTTTTLADAVPRRHAG